MCNFVYHHSKALKPFEYKNYFPEDIPQDDGKPDFEQRMEAAKTTKMRTVLIVVFIPWTSRPKNLHPLKPIAGP